MVAAAGMAVGVAVDETAGADLDGTGADGEPAGERVAVGTGTGVAGAAVAVFGAGRGAPCGAGLAGLTGWTDAGDAPARSAISVPAPASRASTHSVPAAVATRGCHSVLSAAARPGRWCVTVRRDRVAPGE